MSRPAAMLVTLVLLLAGGAAACRENPEDRRCAGDERLCDRRYSDVAFATAHNAMSNEADGWVAPNHYTGIGAQLAGGVRGFMLDTHYDFGEVMLCHGICVFGSRPLDDALVEMRAWLHAHPREILTIIFEANVSAADTEAAFIYSGMIDEVHTQDASAPWPTLQEMIDADRRLVVFTSDPARSPAWYHYEWDYALENPYAAATPADLSCDIDRGRAGLSLFVFNHFLTNPVAGPQLAEQINHNPFLLDRARRCAAERGQIPNFVTVDFWSIGDLIPTVRALNGL